MHVKDFDLCLVQDSRLQKLAADVLMNWLGHRRMASDVRQEANSHVNLSLDTEGDSVHLSSWRRTRRKSFWSAQLFDVDGS